MAHLFNKLQAAVLASALILPASGAFANDWSKPASRTKGTIIGGVAGALVGGTKGAVVGAALGNGVQYARQHETSRHYARRHRHHHRRY